MTSEFKRQKMYFTLIIYVSLSGLTSFIYLFYYVSVQIGLLGFRRVVLMISIFLRWLDIAFLIFLFWIDIFGVCVILSWLQKKSSVSMCTMVDILRKLWWVSMVFCRKFWLVCCLSYIRDSRISRWLDNAIASGYW